MLNIERIESNLRTRLSIYETQNFTRVKSLFEDNEDLVLDYIEYHPDKKQYLVLYFLRQGKEMGIGSLCNDKIILLHPLSDHEYDFLSDYKSLQSLGFTEKAMEWSGLYYDDYSIEEMIELRDMHIDMISFPQIAKKVMK